MISPSGRSLLSLSCDSGSAGVRLTCVDVTSRPQSFSTTAVIFSRAHILDVQISNSMRQGPFAPETTLQALGVEGPSRVVAIPRILRDSQRDLGDICPYRRGLETVRAAAPLVGSLMGFGLRGLLASDLHGTVHDRGERGRHRSRLMFNQQRHDVVNNRNCRKNVALTPMTCP